MTQGAIMRGPTGVTIRLKLSVEDEELLVQCWSPSGLEYSKPINQTSYQRRALRLRLRRNLGDFRTKVGQGAGEDHWAAVTDAVRFLHNKGKEMAFELFGKDLPLLHRIFAEHCSRGLRSSMPPVVQIEGSFGSTLPIELIPLLDLRPPEEIASGDDLLLALGSFPSFAAAVVHTIRPEVVGSSERRRLSNDPNLPMKLFIHAGMDGVRQEADRLQQLHAAGHLDIDGPWPQQLMGEKLLAQRLATCLLDPEVGFLGNPRCRPDQLYHFACDYDGHAQDDARHYFVFSHSGGKPQHLTLGALRGALAEASCQPALDCGSLESAPIVVLNLCDSAVLENNAVVPLPQLFVDRCHCRGVIGTEARVPDTVASAFAREFYGSLLQGASIGASIRNARWAIAHGLGNPLGILYTAYVDPDICVTDPIPAKAFADPNA